MNSLIRTYAAIAIISSEIKRFTTLIQAQEDFPGPRLLGRVEVFIHLRDE